MFKPGDVVRYATPTRGEEDARFVVLEAHYDVPIPRARIRLIDSGMRIEPEEILAIDELQKAQ
jgi:hypothetical protein